MANQNVVQRLSPFLTSSCTNEERSCRSTLPSSLLVLLSASSSLVSSPEVTIGSLSTKWPLPSSAFVFLLAFFTFPQTAFIRKTGPAEDVLGHPLPSGEEPVVKGGSDIDQVRRAAYHKQSYWRSLKICHRTLTRETFLTLVVRPLGLICLPPVLWSALVQSVTINFLVAVTSNVDIAFEGTYRFQSYQVGLCFSAGIIGSIVGIPAGGSSR